MDSSNAPPTQKSTLEPGALYVQKLPSGRPAFVRKPVKIASAKDLIAKALLHSGTMSHLLSRPGKYYPFPVPEADRFNVVSPSTIPSTSFHERGFPNHALSTESRHRCGVCGRYRSPSYHRRHPIIPGRAPVFGVCRKCQNSYTSSDESTNCSSSRRRQRLDREKRKAYKTACTSTQGHCCHLNQNGLPHGMATNDCLGNPSNRCFQGVHAPLLTAPCDAQGCCLGTHTSTQEQHINRMVYMPPQPANFIGSHTHLPSQFDRDTGNFRPSGSGERRNDEEYRSRDRQRRPYDDNSPCCHERHLRHSHSRNPRVHFTDDDESDPRFRSRSYSRTRRRWPSFDSPHRHRARHATRRMTHSPRPRRGCTASEHMYGLTGDHPDLINGPHQHSCPYCAQDAACGSQMHPPAPPEAIPMTSCPVTPITHRPPHTMPEIHHEEVAWVPQYRAVYRPTHCDRNRC